MELNKANARNSAMFDLKEHVFSVSFMATDCRPPHQFPEEVSQFMALSFSSHKPDHHSFSLMKHPFVHVDLLLGQFDDVKIPEIRPDLVC